MPIVCPTHQKNVILACLHPDCHQPRPICQRCIILHSNHPDSVLELCDVNEKLEAKSNDLNQVERELQSLLKAAENAHGVSLVSVLAALSGELSQQRELQKLSLNSMSWDELNGALGQIAKIKLQPQAMITKQQPPKKTHSPLIYIGIFIALCLFFSQQDVQPDLSPQVIDLQNENQQLKLQINRLTEKSIGIWNDPSEYQYVFNEVNTVCSIGFQVKQIPIYLNGIYQGQLFKNSHYDFTNMNLKMHLQLQKEVQSKFYGTKNKETVYKEDIQIQHNKMKQQDDSYLIMLDNRVPLEQNTHYTLSISLNDLQQVWFNSYKNNASKSPYVTFNDQNACQLVLSLIIREQ